MLPAAAPLEAVLVAPKPRPPPAVAALLVAALAGVLLPNDNDGAAGLAVDALVAAPKLNTPVLPVAVEEELPNEGAAEEDDVLPKLPKPPADAAAEPEVASQQSQGW